MRLIKSGTLQQELREGDEVQLRRGSFRISGLDREKKKIFLVDLEAEGNPFPIPAVAIGAEWR